MERRMKVGAKLALLLWAKDEGDGDDVVMIVGAVSQQEGGFSLVFDGEGSPFALRDDWLERIQPTPPDLATVTEEAEYILSLSVGETENGGGFDKTGLRWPSA